MRNSAAQRTAARRSTQSQAWLSEGGLRWALGSAVSLIAIGLFVAAAIYAPDSTRANNRLCLQQLANDEHTSLEAFFQNPAEQDAFVQAVTVCSR